MPSTHSQAAARGLPAIRHPRLADLIRRKTMRARIEATVSRLIDALDAFDGDPDHEPILGAPEINARCVAVMFVPGSGWQAISVDQREWAKGANDDREEEDEHGTDIDLGELDTSDGEADIGAAETVDQTRWGHGSRKDGLEPSLGASEAIDQSHWGQGGLSDLEGRDHA